MSKNKTVAISLIMALLMIVSTFTIGTAQCNQEEQKGIVVNKTVFNETSGQWEDSITARVGDKVTFRINVTYYQNDTKPEEEDGDAIGYQLTNITVEDTLPSCLQYNDSAMITYGNETFTGESYIDGNKIFWNLSEGHNIKLWREDRINDTQFKTVFIEFNATVKTAGSCTNHVDVYGTEHCCDDPLYGEDNATVIAEPSTPNITVEKKILNSETNEWVEYAEGFHLDETVKFKIDITFEDGGTGCDVNNIIVKDQLPCCLIYNQTTEITSTGPYNGEPDIEIDEKTIYWNWTTENTILQNEDTLTITFETIFDNYCSEEMNNTVYVNASICAHCANQSDVSLYYESEDNATIDCRLPDPKFTKEVWNGTAWADKVEAVKGQTIEFKLELEHFGEANLTNITFYDKLPCILEYVEGSSNPTNVSDDKKRIWWNLSNLTMEDADIKTITFEAFVTGTTDCGCKEMELTKENYANVTGELIINECPPETVEFNDTVEIHSLPNCPPSMPDLEGDSLGTVGETLTFYSKAADSDGGNVSYMFDWNDSEEKSWIGPYEEGNEITVTHSWDEPGTYDIRVQAKDIHGIESGWKYYTETVTITETNVTVEMPFFHFRNITATISNNGQADLEDVEWNITVKRCRLLNMRSINISNEGTIDIPAEETGEAYTGKLPLAKIGLATVNITITADDIEPIYKQKTAILLGPAAITI